MSTRALFCTNSNSLSTQNKHTLLHRARAKKHPSRATRRSLQPVANAKEVVLVCNSKDCKRQGALKVLKMFQEMAPEQVEIATECCFAECGMGPNVRTLSNGKVLNYVKTSEDVAKVLQDLEGGSEAS
mmetsp:Transcript_41611/g.50478  ORF Transcript_41611/g.50478 Transcript_41611/m.50478 type:complete len:128 (-) Transcript_41611:94-477(-)